MHPEIARAARIEILEQVELFQHLPSAIVENISEKLVLKFFPGGKTIINKGDKGDCMYVLFDGQVKIHDGEMEVAILGSRNFFGEFSLLDEEPRSMSVTAKTDVVIGALFQNDFYEVLNKHPEVTKDVIKTLLKRLRNQNGRIISQMKQREEELELLVKERTAEVVQQKELVETKNKEIVDSIKYAKRLQEAILPSSNLLATIFSESFIYYQPKDIVAGDFYWMHRSDEFMLVIAADCTGHGVSGALMSMLGVSLLNQIVNEKEITVPSEILNLLHVAVIAALKQEENDSHDGMDIAVCRFDFRKKELQFAGANRPLWLLRNGEMQAYVPDKTPIGGLQVERNNSFANHVIPYAEADVFYLFTDGYADQFGGSNGKKLMTKKFKETLLEIGVQKMEQQKNYLAAYFEQWKGRNEQVDDVLVMGIRI
ncbi:MAG: cyclic nucleotide-binding domain-containing protein [Chitinophagales bacterium]|nr:cyclic nucleotide-binding domain-containing protein [Chitinophagales bacterium]